MGPFHHLAQLSKETQITGPDVQEERRSSCTSSASEPNVVTRGRHADVRCKPKQSILMVLGRAQRPRWAKDQETTVETTLPYFQAEAGATPRCEYGRRAVCVHFTPSETDLGADEKDKKKTRAATHVLDLQEAKQRFSVFSPEPDRDIEIVEERASLRPSPSPRDRKPRRLNGPPVEYEFHDGAMRRIATAGGADPTERVEVFVPHSKMGFGLRIEDDHNVVFDVEPGSTSDDAYIYMCVCT